MRVNQFKENTSKELGRQPEEPGLRRTFKVVLDLRENPGGLLYEGIEVAGHFLKKNQVVVSDRGRVKPTKEYTARSNNGGKEYPVVVVVNRRSPSAARSSPGHCRIMTAPGSSARPRSGRAWFRRSCGLSDNADWRLTTMHYYTPSGRLIQRDYSNISFLRVLH